ncbi:MAG: hypothetical protein JNK23_06935 [Opitutaceae bacterium]|nr:hypothetical protein [Opitutaceae bacterium]
MQLRQRCEFPRLHVGDFLRRGFSPRRCRTLELVQVDLDFATFTRGEAGNRLLDFEHAHGGT